MTEKQALTKVQQGYYDTIIELMDRSNGVPPTIREIMKALGKKAPAPVQSGLDQLEWKGWIKRSKAKSRNIEVIGYEPPLVRSLRHRIDVLESELKELKQQELTSGQMHLPNRLPVLQSHQKAS